MTTYIHRLLLVMGLSVLSVLSVDAQKMDIKVQSAREVRYGYWFLVNYSIESKSDADFVLTTEIEDTDRFEVYNLSDGKDIQLVAGKSMAVNYALRARKAGSLALPKLTVKSGNRTHYSKSPKIKVALAKEPWEFEKGKFKAFVVTEVSKPVSKVSDTLRITYKLYANNVKNSDVHNLMITEFKPPELFDFVSKYEEPIWDDGHTKPNFLGGLFKGEVFRVIDLGSYILKPRHSGSIMLKGGSIKVDYVIDESSTFKKILAPVRTIKNDRSQQIIPINEVVVEVVD